MLFFIARKYIKILSEFIHSFMIQAYERSEQWSQQALSREAQDEIPRTRQRARHRVREEWSAAWEAWEHDAWGGEPQGVLDKELDSSQCGSYPSKHRMASTGTFPGGVQAEIFSA